MILSSNSIVAVLDDKFTDEDLMPLSFLSDNLISASQDMQWIWGIERFAVAIVFLNDKRIK